jgi:hypothetical protein
MSQPVSDCRQWPGQMQAGVMGINVSESASFHDYSACLMVNCSEAVEGVVGGQGTIGLRRGAFVFQLKTCQTDFA